MTRGTTIQAFVAAAFMATGVPAMADGFGFAFGYSGHHHHHHGVDVGVVVGRPAVVARPAPVVVAPAPVVVPAVPVERVWVPPVYSTVSERVWVPTVRTGFRDVPVYDPYGRIVSYHRESYSVSSGYWSLATRQVVIRPGYWTTTMAGRPVPVPGMEAPQAPSEESAPDMGGDEGPGSVDSSGQIEYQGRYEGENTPLRNPGNNPANAIR